LIVLHLTATNKIINEENFKGLPLKFQSETMKVNERFYIFAEKENSIFFDIRTAKIINKGK